MTSHPPWPPVAARGLPWPLSRFPWPPVASRRLLVPPVASRGLQRLSWPPEASRGHTWPSWPRVASRGLPWPLVASRGVPWPPVASRGLPWLPWPPQASWILSWLPVAFRGAAWKSLEAPPRPHVRPRMVPKRAHAMETHSRSTERSATRAAPALPFRVCHRSICKGLEAAAACDRRGCPHY